MRRIGQRKRKASPEERAARAEWKARKRAVRSLSISDALSWAPALTRREVAQAPLRILLFWRSAMEIDVEEEWALDKLLSVTARARRRAFSYGVVPKRGPRSARQRRIVVRAEKRLFADLRSGKLKLGPVKFVSMYPEVKEEGGVKNVGI